MSMNYSNQETSVTVGESIRDEDGTNSSMVASSQVFLFLDPKP